MINAKHKTVQSLQRGIQLLEVIARSKEGVNLRRLATEIGCSSPAAFHLVHTLVESGMVNRLEDPIRFVLGDRFLQIFQEQQNDRIYKAAFEQIRHLALLFPDLQIYFSEMMGEHVFVTVQNLWGTTEPTMVRDRILPPYASAGSMAHLAFWPHETLEQYIIRYPFESYGLLYWKHREAYEVALAQLRERRILKMPEESPRSLKLAVPLFGATKGLVGALTLHLTLPSANEAKTALPRLLREALLSADAFTQFLKS